MSKRARANAHTPFYESTIQTAPPAPPAALFAAHPGWIWRGNLCAHPLAMWPLIANAPSGIDPTVFFALASAHDDATGGYGWYWVGHAMLMIAATGKKIQAPQLVVVMLTTWRRTDVYGSDTESYRAKTAQRAAPADLDSSAPVAVSPAQAGAGASDAPERVVVPPTPLEPVSEALSASGAGSSSHRHEIELDGDGDGLRRIVEERFGVSGPPGKSDSVP